MSKNYKGDLRLPSHEGQSCFHNLSQLLITHGSVIYLSAGLADPMFLPLHPFLSTFENHSIAIDHFKITFGTKIKYKLGTQKNYP